MTVTLRASPFFPGGDGLDGPFPAKRPGLFPKRCLNYSNRQADCTRCIEACPVAAIQVHGVSVTLDQTSCIRCGICRLACPTAVFVETNPPEIRLVESAGEGNDARLELVCPWTTNVDVKGQTVIESRVPGATCLASSRCLGAVSPADLLDLARLGEREVWLNDAACRDCPISHSQDQLLASAAEANEWLTGYGHLPAVRTYSQNTDTMKNEPTTRPVSPLPAENTRRAFLRKAIGVDAVSQSKRAETFYERRRVLRKLARMRQPGDLSASRLPVANVYVNPDLCSACGLCAEFCPGSALKFSADKDVFALEFSVWACVDCGLCALTCPETSISFGDSLDGCLLLEQQPSRLVAGELVQCATCNAPVALSSSNRQCFVCRQRQARPSYLEAP